MSRVLLVLAALFASGTTALAHHSPVMFDQSKPMTLTGTVREFQWTNPHSYIQLIVKNAQGEDEEGKRGAVGRDHHRDAFTVWMAGGGVKGGTSFGQTDDLGYSIVENPVHVHDFNATILHLMGLNHERLTFRYQGRQYRLTDVHGHVVKDIIA